MRKNSRSIGEIQRLKKELDQKKELIEKSDLRITELEYSLYQTRISFTYKIGRFITYIPRMIRGLIMKTGT